jgi:hypothetical protein
LRRSMGSTRRGRDAKARRLQRRDLMNTLHEEVPRISVRRFLESTAGLPKKLEASLHEHPLTTTAAVAGVAFLVGAVTGSRLGRALLLAATPAIVRRLVDGPMGDDLEAYVRKALGKSPTPGPTSAAS